MGIGASFAPNSCILQNCKHHLAPTQSNDHHTNNNLKHQQIEALMVKLRQNPINSRKQAQQALYSSTTRLPKWTVEIPKIDDAQVNAIYNLLINCSYKSKLKQDESTNGHSLNNKQVVKKKRTRVLSDDENEDEVETESLEEEEEGINGSNHNHSNDKQKKKKKKISNDQNGHSILDYMSVQQLNFEQEFTISNECLEKLDKEVFQQNNNHHNNDNNHQDTPVNNSSVTNKEVNNSLHLQEQKREEGIKSLEFQLEELVQRKKELYKLLDSVTSIEEENLLSEGEKQKQPTPEREYITQEQESQRPLKRTSSETSSPTSTELSPSITPVTTTTTTTTRSSVSPSESEAITPTSSLPPGEDDVNKTINSIPIMKKKPEKLQQPPPPILDLPQHQPLPHPTHHHQHQHGPAPPHHNGYHQPPPPPFHLHNRPSTPPPPNDSGRMSRQSSPPHPKSPGFSSNRIMNQYYHPPIPPHSRSNGPPPPPHHMHSRGPPPPHAYLSGHHNIPPPIGHRNRPYRENRDPIRGYQQRGYQQRRFY